MRLRVGDEGDAFDVLLRQTFVEALRDFVIVERRHEGRPDARLEQRFQRRLHRDDHASLAHARLGEQANVSVQTWSCRDDDGGEPRRRALEVCDARAGCVVIEIPEEILNRVGGADERGQQRRLRVEHELADRLRERARTFAEPASAGGVLEERHALGDDRLRPAELGGEGGAVPLVPGEHDERLAQPARAVDSLEDGAEQREIGFEDDENGGAVGPPRHLAHVVPEPEAEHHDRGVILQVHAVGDALRLLAWPSTARQSASSIRCGGQPVVSDVPLEIARRLDRPQCRGNVGVRLAEAGEVAIEMGLRQDVGHGHVAPADAPSRRRSSWLSPPRVSQDEGTGSSVLSEHHGRRPEYRCPTRPP